MTLITTIVPTYNQSDFIDATLRSAVRQIGEFNHQIMVSSDGSSDGTRDRVLAWQHRHPLLISDLSNDQNIGISRNFRRLFSAAQGDFVAILEGDDLWSSTTKLQQQLAFMLRNPECSMVFSKIRVKELPSGKESFLPRQDELKKIKLTGEDFLAEPTLNLIANFSSCLLRTDLVNKLPDALFKGRFNEIAMAFFLERHGPVGFLNDPLSIYHMHQNGVWTGSSRRDQLQSGLIARKAALEVAAPQYKQALSAIIERDFLKPLLSLSE